jgi:hypothetical protein
LLAFDVSARVFDWFSRLFENHRPELPWYQFLHRYFFWRGGASRDAGSRPNA